MIGKKINQLATELAPVSTDLTIIGDPDSGVSKKITLAQLGAIFSGAVSFYTDLASFPATGDINVIYCAKDTQKLYLWSGSAYVEVFPSQALLDTYQLRSEKGNANGYASLDSGGKVPISQLPSSLMEYLGTWNASTNTPTLANGTGDNGDVYLCNVAGTVNFGAGPITFSVGDWVIYNGSIWERSSGSVGTVTSVALTVGGDAISVSGSPLTTSGTLGLTFNGTTAQYIRGNGTLETFPTSLISGTGNVNAIPKFTANTVLGNSVMEDDGNFVSMRGLKINAVAGVGNTINFQQGSGITAAGLGYSTIGAASTTGFAFYIDQNTTSRSFILDTSTITSATQLTYSLPASSGTLALTSDIPSLTGYVPYTGATANVNLGTHTLIAAKGTFSSSGSGDTVGITHSSGSGIALNITKGGNGEGLYINKTSGSGNAATIIGTLNATTLVKSGGTSSEFLKADGSVDSTAYGTGSVTSVGLSSATSGVTIGSTPITTSGTITLAIATASGSQQGLLSSTDWTTFNNKQNALTNPVTGTGTTNYLPKFTGASTIGNSSILDNGAGRVSIGTTSFLDSFVISNSGAAGWEFSNTGSVITYNRSTAAYIPMTFEASNYILNRGNLGLGVTPSAWYSTDGYAALQVGNASLFGRNSANSELYLGTNVFANSSGNTIYITSNFASRYEQRDGVHKWQIAPSGTAGNAISFTQAMTLNASGNLSIGNTNDTYKLDVTGTGRFTTSIIAASTITLSNDGTYGSTYKTIGFTGTTNGFHRIFAGTSDDMYICASDGRGIQFWTNGTTGAGVPKLTIASTGAATFSSSVTATQLLVNESSPKVILTPLSYSGAYRTTLGTRGSAEGVLQLGNNNPNYIVGGNTGAGGSLHFYVNATSDFITSTNGTLALVLGSSGAATFSSSVSTGAALTVTGTNSTSANNTITGYSADLYALAIRQKGASAGISGTNFMAQIISATGAEGLEIYTPNSKELIFGTNATERLRITSGGLVLFGTTSAPSASVSGFCIEGSSSGNISSSGASTSAYNHLLFYNGNGLVGYISTSGSTTTYSTSSDYRLKQDYKDYSGLDLVNKIKTYDYEWKADKTRGYGVIAHELQSVINYAVTGVKDGKEMQGVDYSKIVPVLIKAIQELNDKIK
jgi:hypothetical protein